MNLDDSEEQPLNPTIQECLKRIYRLAEATPQDQSRFHGSVDSWAGYWKSTEFLRGSCHPESQLMLLVVDVLAHPEAMILSSGPDSPCVCPAET